LTSIFDIGAIVALILLIVLVFLTLFRRGNRLSPKLIDITSSVIFVLFVAFGFLYSAWLSTTSPIESEIRQMCQDAIVKAAINDGVNQRNCREIAAAASEEIWAKKLLDQKDQLTKINDEWLSVVPVAFAGWSRERFESVKPNVPFFQRLSGDIAAVTFGNVILVTFYTVLVATTLAFSRMLRMKRMWRLPNRLAFEDQTNQSMFIATSRKWADSVYFLGFILTLIALVFALGQTGLESGQDGSAKIQGTIIQNAFALVSTVAALIFRVVWIQCLPDQGEPADAVEDLLRSQTEAISAALATLRGQTEELTTIVNGVAATVGKAMETLTPKANSAGDALDSFSTKVARVEIAEEAVTEAVAKVFREAISKIDEGARTLSSAVSEGGESIRGSLNSVALTAKDTDLDEVISSAITTATHPLRDGLKEEVDAAKDILSATAASISKQSDKVAKGFKTLANDISNTTLSSAEFRERLEELRGELDNFLADARRSLEATDLSGISELLSNNVDTISDIRDRVAGVADRYREATDSSVFRRAIRIVFGRRSKP